MVFFLSIILLLFPIKSQNKISESLLRYVEPTSILFGFVSSLILYLSSLVLPRGRMINYTQGVSWNGDQ